MESLAQYLSEYMNRLGLDPSQWADYARMVQGGGPETGEGGALPFRTNPRTGRPVMRVPKMIGDYWRGQFKVPREPGIPPGPVEGRSWGIHKQILNPPAGSSDADIEFLKRARLHQALAPRGLYEALGGK